MYHLRAKTAYSQLPKLRLPDNPSWFLNNLWTLKFRVVSAKRASFTHQELFTIMLWRTLLLNLKLTSQRQTKNCPSKNLSHKLGKTRASQPCTGRLCRLWRVSRCRRSIMAAPCTSLSFWSHRCKVVNTQIHPRRFKQISSLQNRSQSRLAWLTLSHESFKDKVRSTMPACRLLWVQERPCRKMQASCFSHVSTRTRTKAVKDRHCRLTKMQLI